MRAPKIYPVLMRAELVPRSPRSPVHFCWTWGFHVRDALFQKNIHVRSTIYRILADGQRKSNSVGARLMSLTPPAHFALDSETELRVFQLGWPPSRTSPLSEKKNQDWG